MLNSYHKSWRHEWHGVWVARSSDALRPVTISQRERRDGAFVAGQRRFALQPLLDGVLSFSSSNCSAPTALGEHAILHDLDADGTYVLMSLSAFFEASPFAFMPVRHTATKPLDVRLGVEYRGDGANRVYRCLLANQSRASSPALVDLGEHSDLCPPLIDAGVPEWHFAQVYAKLVCERARSAGKGILVRLGSFAADGTEAYLLAPPPEQRAGTVYNHDNLVRAVDLVMTVLRNLLNNHNDLLGPSFRIGEAAADGEGWTLFSADFVGAKGVSPISAAACARFADHFGTLLGADAILAAQTVRGCVPPLLYLARSNVLTADTSQIASFLNGCLQTPLQEFCGWWRRYAFSAR